MSRTAFLIFFSFLLIYASCSRKMAAAADRVITDTLTRDSLIRVNQDPSRGFNYSYFLFLPKGTPRNHSLVLMVETNNTGLNDTLAYHEKLTRQAAGRSALGSGIARRLKIPLLMPVFPRSSTDWTVYTHALDRDALLSRDVQGIHRLDLQLLAMVDHAGQVLASHNISLREKFFLNGFSASGTFANRFSLLHPGKIQAVAAGGLNAILMLPQKKIGERKLPYPLGTADLQSITGKRADIAAYRQVPKFLYMGALDDNDAAAFDDAYSQEERDIIYTLMGRTLPERWEFMQKT